MEAKLEIKHLSAYLPYDLEMCYEDNTEFHIEKLSGVDTDCIRVESEIDYPPFTYKPILRPLSDLTCEIEHNGERFVPLFKLEPPHFYGQDKKDVYKNIVDGRISYRQIQQLLSWHFDIFGLLDQNLSIDKNKL